jgi:hypothetical protein
MMPPLPSARLRLHLRSHSYTRLGTSTAGPHPQPVHIRAHAAPTDLPLQCREPRRSMTSTVASKLMPMLQPPGPTRNKSVTSDKPITSDNTTSHTGAPSAAVSVASI